MARPLRIEFPGALYHLTSRGDGRESIYLTDSDREQWLALVAEVCRRYSWLCYAYCLMGNHYHLLAETQDANMSQGMRQLNGVYAQRFNRVHGRVGHVFQGRYTAILVDKDNYLQELARYIVLNPVRAGMVHLAADWPWSSYRATAGLAVGFPWLHADRVLSLFGSRRKAACERYRRFVEAGKHQSAPWDRLRNQLFLGSEDFVNEMQSLIDPDAALAEIPRQQKRKAEKSIADFQQASWSRDEAIYRAYRSGGYKMNELAVYFSLHYSSISKIVKRFENSRFKT